MKLNEFNYLIYINELHKKIFKLEQELNIKDASKIIYNQKIKIKNYKKVFSVNDLKIRNQSFTINSLGQKVLDSNILENKEYKKK